MSRFLTIFSLFFALAAGLTPARAESLDDFLQEIRASAAQAGVSQQTIEASLGNFQPIEHVIELDQKQPETTMSFDQYVTKVASQARIDKGRALLAENEGLLQQISTEYGVPAPVIVALWGVESSFGNSMGDYPIIQSLATLAYEGRRHDFFKGELIKAMQIVDAGDVSMPEMVGSWAGAMGQIQFMPSTFLNFAVDYDHSGRRDIWYDSADVFASAANYLSKSGWHAGEGWGREVRFSAPLNQDLVGADKTPRTVTEWARLGVRNVNGSPLPQSDVDANLIMPDGSGGRAFLVYNNFRVLMRWNHSTFFATTIGLLSNAIASP